MASTFKELYSDFQDSVKNYTEKLDVTERQFMRRITRAVQLFQRDTEYITRAATLNIGANPLYPNEFEMPTDCIHILEFRDINDLPLFNSSYKQHRRILDQQRNGGIYLESPVDNQYRIRHLYNNKKDIQRTITVLNRRIILNPIDPTKDLTISIVYYPDISAYSENDIEWALWNASNADFNDYFANAKFTPEIQHYEHAFLNYAIADFIKSQGNINYRVYEQKYLEEVQNAKDNKRTYLRGAIVEYNFGTNA